MMKSTRRQFMGQVVKAGFAVLAGVLGGAALAEKPKPMYGMPIMTDAERCYVEALEKRWEPLSSYEKRQAFQRHLATLSCPPFEVEVRNQGDCGFAVEAWDRPSG